ncbi:MAG: PaaI family thioesterase [Sphingobium limneticum]
MALIGAQVMHASHGRVVLELPFRPDLCQQNGVLHGGVVGAMADVAGGYAAYSVFGQGEDVLTVEYKLNLIRPAAGECLRATPAGRPAMCRPFLSCRSRLPAATGSAPCRCGEGNPPSSKAASFPPAVRRRSAQYDVGASLPVSRHLPSR